MLENHIVGWILLFACIEKTMLIGNMRNSSLGRWKYADIVSRVLTLSELKENDLWTNGPISYTVKWFGPLLI